MLNHRLPPTTSVSARRLPLDFAASLFADGGSTSPSAYRLPAAEAAAGAALSAPKGQR